MLFNPEGYKHPVGEKVRSSLAFAIMLVTLKNATSILGKFPWLSCRGHVLNLVASDGFDKVDADSKLVTKCKQTVGYT